jgi:hypothetical protein
MVTSAGTSVPNNVTGATIGALVSTIALWLLGLIPGFQHMPDDVKQAVGSLIIVGFTYIGGLAEHFHRKPKTT